MAAMKMAAMAMSVTDWCAVEPTQHPGSTGMATWRTRTFGELRVRMVEYSAGYAADHWCAKGHVLLCLEGSLDIEIADGKRLRLESGLSYHVGDGDPPHRSSTAGGARLFIVD
jgi:hypothetical protein